MSIQQLIIAGSRPPVTPGSQVFTSSGTFTVPYYNTITVVAEGGTGATGAPGADDYNSSGGVCPGGSGGAGGIGGKSTKAYTSGLSVGASITVSIVSGTTVFDATVTANVGGTGNNGENGIWVTRGGDEYCEGGGAGVAGSNGTASGGDTNITGGSTTSTAKLTITWS